MTLSDSCSLSQHRSSRRLLSSWLQDCLLITLVACFLYGLYLGSYPLVLPDEGRYSDVVREMLQTGDYVTPHLNGIPFLDKPPLFYWIQSAFVRLLGLNEWGLRLWPATIATLGCLGTYLTGRQLFNRSTGWLAAAILGTSAFYCIMAHVADLDLTLAIFVALSLFSFLLATAVTKPSHTTLYYYSAYIFSALAILTKGLIGLVIPMMVIGLWILIRRDWRLLLQMRIPTSLLLILVICAPWFLLIQHRNPDFFYYFFYVQQIHRYVTHEFNSHEGFWFYPCLLLIGMLPWSGFMVMALIKKVRLAWTAYNQHPSQLFLLIWIMSVTLFFSIPPSKTVGYILPVFPALALVTAVYITEKQESITHLYKAVRIPLIISLLAYSGFMIYFTQQHDRFAFASSKPLATQLKKILNPSDAVVFYEDYYQDLALYLNHNVLLGGDFQHEKKTDNWRQDFSEGLKDPQYSKRLLTPTQLHTLWSSSKRVYAVMLSHRVAPFKKIIGTAYYPMGQYKTLWLFSNHPPPSIHFK